MVAGDAAVTGGMPAIDRPLPPVTELAIASMALVIVGGIYIAAYLPKTVPLAPAVVLLVLAGGILAWNLASLRGLRDFSWGHFSLVFRWAFLAYAIIAGMLEYVFVVDNTRGGQLLVTSLMLLLFAINIPLLMAFTVARYQPASVK